MKFLLALGFGLCTIALSAQESAGIEYSPTSEFHWGMFKGKINPQHLSEMGVNTGAVTVSSLSYETIGISGDQVKIRITALFNPWESWTRYPKLEHPDEALNHEKRHFDICEIYARRIRQVIGQAHFTRANFNEKLNALYKKLVADYRDTQSRYDLETSHSLDAKAQEKWNAAIDLQMKALSDYSNPIVTVTLN